MRKLNPEHIKALIELSNQRPCFRLLSMEVQEMGAGYAWVSAARVRAPLTNLARQSAPGISPILAMVEGGRAAREEPTSFDVE